MIVIGADTHKSTHTLAAVQAETGRIVATKTVRADADGMLAGWRWAHALDGGERVWALEDCRHVSGRLERCLVGQGERVVRVAPKLMGQTRRHERRPGKSDEIDAVAVARAAIREGIERLPVAFLEESSFEVRLLSDHRNDLVAERPRHQNRLRWHLVELDPDLEAELPARALDRECWIERVARRLSKLPQTARVRVARDELRRIRELTRAERALERELRSAISALRPDVLAEDGIGTITAATLIGHTAGAARFPTDGHFARLAGAAPIPASSGAPSACGSTAAATANSTAHYTASPSPAPAPARTPAPTSTANSPKARRMPRPTAASNDTSPAASGTYSPAHPTRGPLQP